MITINGKDTSIEDLKRLDSALHRIVLAISRRDRLQRRADRAAARVTELVQTSTDVERWIDFNGGGWTWSGIAGTPIGWRHVPKSEEQANG